MHYAVTSTPAEQKREVGELALDLSQVPGIRVALRSTNYEPSSKPTVFLRQLQHTYIVCSNATGGQPWLAAV